MQNQTQRTSRGRHRKFTASQTAKGRIALVAVATGAVSTAGVGGAAAAQLQYGADEQDTASEVDIQLAADADPIEASLGSSAPQILNIAEYKPVTNLEEQLNTAVDYNNQRVEEAEAVLAEAAAPLTEGLGAVAQSGVAKPAEGVFTSGFGPRWGTFHAGIDIASAIGTPILAVMDGTVIDSGPASGYGQWIRVQHDDGSISVYGHMVSLDVGVGERVAAGQKIAGMGSEGFSTGSHLHFEIWPDGNSAVDPVPWFAERGISI